MLAGKGRIVPPASLWIVAMVACAAVAAQEPEKVSGSITPDGQFTMAQAEQGARQFEQTCVACHTLAEHSGSRLKARWDGTTVADLLELISNTMPASDPGSLTREQYISIIAYLLKETGYQAGERPLPSDVERLKRVAISAR